MRRTPRTRTNLATQTAAPFSRCLLCLCLVVFLAVGYACGGRNPKAMESAPAGHILVGYVWGFDDIGGIAITPGLLNLLNEHFPDYQITTFGGSAEARSFILDLFPDCTAFEDRFRGTAYREALSEARKHFRGRLPPLDESVADYALGPFTDDLVAALRRSSPEFMEAVERSDLLILPSGMMLNYGKSTLAGTDFWGETVRLSLPLMVARKLGVPYGLYGQSFTAFEGPGAVRFFKTLLEDARFVTCRDGDSLNYIRSLGIEPPGLMFVPDSTFSFGRRDDAWAERFLAENGLETHEFLVVIPRTWPRNSRITELIGKKRSEMHTRKLRRIIADWVHRTGMKVLIAPETRGQEVNSRHQIYEPLPPDVKSRCVNLDEFWISDQAAAVFRRARMLLTMEQHSFLLAIPEATPTVVAISAESGRKRWMLRDFGLPECLFDIDADPVAEIEKALYHIHENYEAERRRLETGVIPRMRAIERRQMELIAEALQAGRRR